MSALTLRVLLDPLLDTRPSGTRRSAVSLAREIVRRESMADLLARDPGAGADTTS